jgi:L-ascorbate metabolism protein UlaG (beta-lactamase superfamily)
MVSPIFIECNQIIGCHYDTFPYIEIDHDDAISKFENAGKDLKLMKIGETIEY